LPRDNLVSNSEFCVEVGDGLPRGFVKALGFMEGNVQMLGFNDEPFGHKFAGDKIFAGKAEQVCPNGFATE
jgi:hypothetical protein